MAIASERMGQYLRELVAFLAQRQEADKTEVFAHLERVVQPSGDELAPEGDGGPHWLNRVNWSSVILTRGTEWLSKDGGGKWSITPKGLEALDQYPDPVTFRDAAEAIYDDWRKSRPKRRAWLLRGSSVTGVNVVPNWLTDGFCSVAGSQLPVIEPGIEPADLRAVVEEAYSHLSHHELRAKSEEIVAFVTRMREGDLVLTTSEGQVYVGDVAGDWMYEASEGNRTNLRRAVQWRNSDAPIDFSDLPAPLPARLQTGRTLVDLTADVELIDQLGEPTDAALVDSVEMPPTRPHHEHLPQPSPELAGALFVKPEWLAEVRDVLDERRQLVFYGPPGTGKTYIAQKLAEDLVGPEQVKLVQFHPAYTYEDFFEGYRPVPAGGGGGGSAGSGTISFELRPGPFRHLVDRAREHPDQAFVLIIDEINRANLAKVFGELYFLLEYRDQAVDLLYSSDEEGFTLPRNLYLIGTMNTADRSIALVDAAMRRRFAFEALSPDEEPTRSLLRTWSEHHGLGTVAADLLERLNGLIEDPDFRIGPAYFMKRADADAHSPARLERIWRTSIVPLLQEHHYGEWESVQNRYKLAPLLRAVAASAPATTADKPLADDSPPAPLPDTTRGDDEDA